LFIKENLKRKGEEGLQEEDDFFLSTAFPKRIFTNEEIHQLTLQKVGLGRGGNLLLVKREKKNQFESKK
jgi:hypothetical protein